MTSDAGSLDRARFRYFPVVPSRLEFAVEVRREVRPPWTFRLSRRVGLTSGDEDDQER